MYSPQQASQLRHEFWTAFGRYMSPVLSAEGWKINWINYKTGVKHIQFKMQAGSRSATISIELNHPDADRQQICLEQFQQLKNMLQALTGEEWIWELHAYDDSGKLTSRIYKEITGVSVFNKQDWPVIISFLKQRIIALDEFWSNARFSFEDL
jgi:hypothetical protein